MSAREREVRKIVEGCGLAAIEIGSTGSGHIYSIVRSSDGREKKFFFSRTPSDRRGDMNKASLLRRFAINAQPTNH